MENLTLITEQELYFVDRVNFKAYQVLGYFQETKDFESCYLLQKGKSYFILKYRIDYDCDGTFHNIYLNKISAKKVYSFETNYKYFFKDKQENELKDAERFYQIKLQSFEALE
jgi:hypothetical protein